MIQRIYTHAEMEELETRPVFYRCIGKELLDVVAGIMNRLEYDGPRFPLEQEVLANIRARLAVTELTTKLYGFSSYLAQSYYNDKHNLDRCGRPKRTHEFKIDGWDLT